MECSGSVVDCFTRDEGLRVRASPASLCCFLGQNTLNLAQYWFNPGRLSYKVAQRYCKAESTSSHLAGVATIIDLFCWVPCQEFVLIIYAHIAHVLSILSVHITDVDRFY